MRMKSLSKTSNTRRKFFSNDRVLCRSQGGTYEECRNGTYLSAVAFWFNCFGIAIESIICFIFFGLRQKHLHLWRNLIFAKIGKCRKKCFDERF